MNCPALPGRECSSLCELYQIEPESRTSPVNDQPRTARRSEDGGLTSLSPGRSDDVAHTAITRWQRRRSVPRRCLEQLPLEDLDGKAFPGVREPTGPACAVRRISRPGGAGKRRRIQKSSAM